MSTHQNKSILVSEVMLGLDRVPVVRERSIFKEALERMGEMGHGIACVVDENMLLKGVITDGDIRRKLLSVQKPFAAFLVDDSLVHAIQSPTTIASDISLVDAVLKMEEKQVWDLPVVDREGALIGLLHLHPAVKLLLEMRY